MVQLHKPSLTPANENEEPVSPGSSVENRMQINYQ